MGALLPVLRQTNTDCLWKSKLCHSASVHANGRGPETELLSLYQGDISWALLAQLLGCSVNMKSLQDLCLKM